MPDEFVPLRLFFSAISLSLFCVRCSVWFHGIVCVKIENKQLFVSKQTQSWCLWLWAIRERKPAKSKSNICKALQCTSATQKQKHTHNTQDIESIPPEYTRPIRNECVFCLFVTFFFAFDVYRECALRAHYVCCERERSCRAIFSHISRAIVAIIINGVMYYNVILFLPSSSVVVVFHWLSAKCNLSLAIEFDCVCVHELMLCCWAQFKNAWLRTCSMSLLCAVDSIELSQRINKNPEPSAMQETLMSWTLK